MISRQIIFTAAALALSVATSFAGDANNNQSPQVRAENQLNEIRDQAVRGGYESQLDRAVENYGGTRTKEVVHEQQAIRNGAHNGSGHDGDNDQPGLTGTEGRH